MTQLTSIIIASLSGATVLLGARKLENPKHDQAMTKGQGDSKGPFKYYVIKILTILDPTHSVCNQTLLIKQAYLML